MRLSTQSGVTLVEVITGVAIVSIILIAIGFSVQTYVETRNTLLVNLEAAYLAEEGYETIRHIRDEDWTTVSALPINTTRYLSVSTTTRAFSTTPEVIDTSYRRSFKLQSVYRNGSDDIVASTAPGATLDSDSREVEVSVAGPNGTTTFEAILTNLYDI
jgi:prepilin-type N-terminal cleavage/methylation domain-containing protein